MKFKESEKTEFKKSTAELNQALVSLCAFANSGEGTIYFGISDKGEAVGQHIGDNTLKKVSTTILSSIEPRIYPNIYIQKMDERDILVLRNPGIAEILFLAGYIERWGIGIKQMNSLMKEYGLRPPEYEEIGGNFVVTFKKKKPAVKTKPKMNVVPGLSQVCPK